MNRTSLLRTSLAGVLALSTGALVTSCIRGPCTEIGCEDEVGITVADVMTKYGGVLPLTIQACVDQLCQTMTVTAAAPNQDCAPDMPGPFCCSVAFDPHSPDTTCGAGSQDVSIKMQVLENDSGGSVHPVTVTVQDQGGHVLLSSHKSATLFETGMPNGPECGNTCFGGAVTFASQ